MSSSKKILFIAALFSSLVLFSCGDKQDEEEVILGKDFENREVLIAEARRVLGDSVNAVFKGDFVKDSLEEVAAVIEILDRDVWGIKFFLLKIENGELNKTYETNLLDGSLNESRLEKIHLDGYDYALLYYNSLSYFLGSGGGEIFSYIIDFNEQKTFYAHLVTDKKNGISLFLSDNTNPAVKDFFVKNFKKDYPSLTLVANDIDLSF